MDQPARRPGSGCTWGNAHRILADTDHVINQERPAGIAQAINRIIEELRRDNRAL